MKDTAAAADGAAAKIKRRLPVIAVLGPAPAIIGRLLSKFRFQIVIKLSKQVGATHRLPLLEMVLDEIDLDLKRAFGNSVTFFPDVDP